MFSQTESGGLCEQFTERLSQLWVQRPCTFVVPPVSPEPKVIIFMLTFCFCKTFQKDL